MNTELIANFFHEIAPKVISLTKQSLATNAVVVQKKHSSDFATHLDVDVETYVVSEIKKRFPDDTVLAEEAHKSTNIGKGRTWIIDPICGTNNLGRNISAYCSNIALAEDGELIAACVVDLTQYEYYWSVGGGVIYRGSEVYNPIKPVGGTVVDVDFGCTAELSQPMQASHLASIRWLEQHTDFVFVSFNTSLSFLYVALHKLDGVMNVAANSWDIAASAFLGMQSGCVVAQYDGKTWSTGSRSIVMAADEATQKMLIKALKYGYHETESAGGVEG